MLELLTIEQVEHIVVQMSIVHGGELKLAQQPLVEGRQGNRHKGHHELELHLGHKAYEDVHELGRENGEDGGCSRQCIGQHLFRSVSSLGQLLVFSPVDVGVSAHLVGLPLPLIVLVDEDFVVAVLNSFFEFEVQVLVSVELEVLVCRNSDLTSIQDYLGNRENFVV